MLFTPSKIHLSSAPRPLVLQDPASHPSCSPHHLTLLMQAGQRAKRNLWTRWLWQQAVAARFLLSSLGGIGQAAESARVWTPRACPLPKASCWGRPRWHHRICRLGPWRWDQGMWKGSTEGLGCVCNARSPARDWSVSLLSWFISPGFLSCSKSQLTSACLYSACSRPLFA